MSLFSHIDLEAIAKELGDSNDGLRAEKIKKLLRRCDIEDIDSTMSNQDRLFEAFVANQDTTQSSQKIFNFITEAMQPVSYANDRSHYKVMRKNLNHALYFSGYEVTEEGTIISVKKITKLREIDEKDLHENLTARRIHSDVLECCVEKLKAEDYFHAALAVTKSVADKLRSVGNLELDGMRLASAALSGKKPRIAINGFQTRSEINEQKGFLNLIEGIFRMFRHPTAHESTANWEINKADMEDLLSIASLIHRRLDAIKKTHRT